MRSRTVRRSQTDDGEKRGRRSTAAPAACAAYRATTMPWMWCSGSACSSRSAGRHPQAPVSALTWAEILLWVCTTPGRVQVPGFRV